MIAWWLCGAGSLSHTCKVFIENFARRVPREAGMPAVANVGTGRFGVSLFMKVVGCMIYGDVSGALSTGGRETDGRCRGWSQGVPSWSLMGWKEGGEGVVPR